MHPNKHNELETPSEHTDFTATIYEEVTGLNKIFFSFKKKKDLCIGSYTCTF